MTLKPTWSRRWWTDGHVVMLRFEGCNIRNNIFFGITGNVCTIWCVVSTKLNVCRQICASTIKMQQWCWRNGTALIILVVSTVVYGRWLFCMSAVSCQHESVCKLWDHCTQSLQSHKPWKVNEVLVMSSSTRPRKTKFQRKFDILVT